jgi:hypothetical protein
MPSPQLFSTVAGQPLVTCIACCQGRVPASGGEAPACSQKLTNRQHVGGVVVWSCGQSMHAYAMHAPEAATASMCTCRRHQLGIPDQLCGRCRSTCGMLLCGAWRLLPGSILLLAAAFCWLACAADMQPLHAHCWASRSAGVALVATQPASAPFVHFADPAPAVGCIGGRVCLGCEAPCRVWGSSKG